MSAGGLGRWPEYWVVRSEGDVAVVGKHETLQEAMASVTPGGGHWVYRPMVRTSPEEPMFGAYQSANGDLWVTPPLPALGSEGGVTDVTPNLREMGECGCSDQCGAYGTLKRAWRDGSRCVARKCKCKRCQGKQNRRSGLAKQRVARKALGIRPQKFGDANEERWSDLYFANEVKSGKQCGPVANWWLRVEAQVMANEADFGDRRRPARVVAMPEGWPDGLVVVRLSTWETHVRPALEEFYGSGA